MNRIFNTSNKHPALSYGIKILSNLRLKAASAPIVTLLAISTFVILAGTFCTLAYRRLNQRKVSPNVPDSLKDISPKEVGYSPPPPANKVNNVVPDNVVPDEVKLKQPPLPSLAEANILPTTEAVLDAFLVRQWSSSKENSALQTNLARYFPSFGSNFFNSTGFLRDCADLTQLGLLAHVHMDRHLHGSSKALNKTPSCDLATSVTFFHHLIKAINLNGVIPGFDQEIEQLMGLVKSHGPFPIPKIIEGLAGLKDGEWYHVPGGWKEHFILYSFQKQEGDCYDLYLCNSGPGVSYHDRVATPNHQKYSPAVVWRGISRNTLLEEDRSNYFFKALGELHTEELNGCFSRDEFLYQDLLSKHFGRAWEYLDEELFIRSSASESATSRWRTFMGLILLRSKDKQTYLRVSYFLQLTSLMAFDLIFQKKQSSQPDKLATDQMITCLDVVSEHFLVKNAKYYSPSASNNLIDPTIWQEAGAFVLEMRKQLRDIKGLKETSRRTIEAPEVTLNLSVEPLVFDAYHVPSSAPMLGLQQKLSPSIEIRSPQKFCDLMATLLKAIPAHYNQDPQACGRVVEAFGLALPDPRSDFWDEVPDPVVALDQLDQLLATSVYLFALHWDCGSLKSLIKLSYMAGIHRLALRADEQYRNSPNSCSIEPLAHYGVWFDLSDADDGLIDRSRFAHEKREALIDYFSSFNQDKPILFGKNHVTFPCDLNSPDLVYYSKIIKNSDKYREILEEWHLESPKTYMAYWKELPTCPEGTIPLILDDREKLKESSGEDWAKEVFEQTAYQIFIYHNEVTNQLDIYRKNGNKFSINFKPSNFEKDYIEAIQDQLNKQIGESLQQAILVSPNGSPALLINNNQTYRTSQRLTDFYLPGTEKANPEVRTVLKWLLDFGEHAGALREDKLDHIVVMKRAQALLRLDHLAVKCIPPWEADAVYTVKVSYSGKESILTFCFCNEWVSFRAFDSTNKFRKRRREELPSPHEVAVEKGDPIDYFHTTVATRPLDIIAHYRRQLHLLKKLDKSFAGKETSGVQTLVDLLLRGFVRVSSQNTRIASCRPFVDQIGTQVFMDQVEGLVSDAFSAFFFSKTYRKKDDFEVCCGLIWLLLSLKEELPSDHVNFARLAAMLEKCLLGLESAHPQPPELRGAAALLRVLVYKSTGTLLKDEDVQRIFTCWLTYKLCYKKESEILPSEAMQTASSFVYSLATQASTLSWGVLCSACLQDLEISSIAPDEWKGTFPQFATPEYQINLLQGRVISEEGEFFLNRSPEWSSCYIAKQLFNKRTHVYVTQGSCIYFIDAVWGNCRVLPPQEGKGANKLDERLQVQMEGNWYQLVDPGTEKKLISLPKPLLVHHFHWVFDDGLTVRMMITTTTGKPVAAYTQDAGLRSMNGYSLSPATDEEAGFYAPFERKEYVLVEKTDDEAPSINKISLPRYKTNSGSALSFDRVYNRNKKEWLLVRSDQRNQFVSSKRVEGVLGSFTEYIYLEDFRGQHFVLIPVLNFQEMEPFSTLVSVDIPAKDPKEGPWCFLEFPLHGQFSFIELKVVKGKPKAETPEGHLFLAYLTLMQKQYERALKHLKRWNEWPVDSPTTSQLRTWIIDSDRLSSDGSVKGQAVRDLVNNRNSGQGKHHYLPWRFTKDVSPIAPCVNALVPSVDYTAGLQFQWSPLQQLQKNDGHTLFIQIGKDSPLAILSNNIKRHFLFYYGLAVGDSASRRLLTLYLRYMLKCSDPYEKPLTKDLRQLLLFAYHFHDIAPKELKNSESCGKLIDAYNSNQQSKLVTPQITLLDVRSHPYIPYTQPAPFTPALKATALKIEWKQLTKRALYACPVNDLVSRFFTLTCSAPQAKKGPPLNSPFSAIPLLQGEEAAYQSAVELTFKKYENSLIKGISINRKNEIRVDLQISPSEIFKTLQEYKEVQDRAVQMALSSLHQLLNKGPADPEQAFHHQLLKESGHLPTLKFDDIMPWVLRGKSHLKGLVEYNSYLTDDDLDRLWVLAHDYLVQATYAQQIDRAIVACGDCSRTNVLTKDNTLKLYKELSKQRQYDTYNAMPLLIVEYVSDILLRPSQYVALRSLFRTNKIDHSFRNIVRQIIMGDGKTTVIARLMALFRCQPGKLALFIPFTPQYESLKEDMGFGMKHQFGLPVQTTDLSLQQMNKVELKNIYQSLRKAVAVGELAIMKKETILFLILRSLTVLVPYADKEGPYQTEDIEIFDLCRKIFQLWQESAEAIGDEAHELLDVTKQVNIPIGEAKAIADEDVLLGSQIFAHLANLLDKKFNVDGREQLGRELVNMVLDEEGKQIALRVNLDAYKTYLVPIIVDQLLGSEDLPIPNQYRAGASRYLNGTMTAETCSDEDTAFLRYHKDLSEHKPDTNEYKQANMLALAKDMLQTIMPFSLSRKHNVDYGRVDAQLATMLGMTNAAVCPYNQGQPSPTKFGNSVEEMCYYFQSNLLGGITDSEFKDWTKGWRTEALLYSEQFNVLPNETPASKNFKQFVGYSLFQLSEPGVFSKALSAINKDPLKRLQIEISNVKKYVNVYEEYLSAGPHTLVHALRSLQTFSGTTRNKEEYHYSLDVQEVAGTEGRILDRFLNKPRKDLSVPSQSPTTFLSDCYSQLEPGEIQRVNAIIDTGAYFCQQPGFGQSNNLLCAKHFLKQSAKNIEGILYFDYPPVGAENEKNRYPDALFLLKKTEPQPIFVGKTDRRTIEGLGIDLENLMVFYDNRHIVSTDLPLPPNAICLMTWSMRQTLTNNLQGAVRAREYLEGNQQLYFVDLKDEPQVGARESVSAKEEAFEFARRTTQSYFMQLNTSSWMTAFHKLFSFDNNYAKEHRFALACQYFTKTKKILVVKNDLSHYQRCGHLPHKQKTLKIMESLVTQQQNLLNAAGIDVRLFAKEAKKILERASDSKMLIHEIDTHATHLSSIGQQAQVELIHERAAGGNIILEQAYEQDQENHIDKEIDLEWQREVRQQLAEKTNLSSGIAPLATWTYDQVAQVIDSLLKNDLDQAKQAAPTGLLPIKETFTSEKENYSDLFHDVQLYITENQRFTYTNQLVSIFHPHQKPCLHLLLIKRDNDFLGIMLAMGEQEADVFHSYLAKNLQLQNVWMVHINGTPLHDATPRYEEDQDLLWSANFFEGNLPFLMKNMKIGHNWWKKLSIESRQNARHYMGLRLCQNDHNWDNLKGFLKRLDESFTA